MFLSREDFTFTIGYDGPRAVVDGQAKRRCGSLSAGKLAERGLFRAAWSSAVYSENMAEKQLVLDIYNKAAGTSYKAENPPDRLFGVFPVDVRRAIVL
ncbi:MAG: hypothetical protein LBI67_01855 [Treponema sp.]|jgi:hypothetical protein|nr:hypothetical protein [Treponema sp.]